MQAPRYLTRMVTLGFREDLVTRLAEELERVDAEGYRIVSVVALVSAGLRRNDFLIVAERKGALSDG